VIVKQFDFDCKLVTECLKLGMELWSNLGVFVED